MGSIGMRSITVQLLETFNYELCEWLLHSFCSYVQLLVSIMSYFPQNLLRPIWDLNP